MKDKKKKIKYHDPPMKFDVALRKYIPDLLALEKIKRKLKKRK